MPKRRCRPLSDIRCSELVGRNQSPARTPHARLGSRPRRIGACAANRGMDSDVEIARRVMPLRQGVSGFSSTCPAELCCTRSLDSVGCVV